MSCIIFGTGKGSMDLDRVTNQSLLLFRRLRIISMHQTASRNKTFDSFALPAIFTEYYVDCNHGKTILHFCDVIMGAMAPQITSLAIAYLVVHSGADQRTSKLRVTGLCVGNSPVNVEFLAQMASNAENVSIWWCYHGTVSCYIK